MGGQWLMREIGRFLAGDGAAEPERDRAAREALANGHAAFAEFTESRCRASDVVVTHVELARTTGHTCRHAFRVVPGPLARFVFCAAHQVTAGAGSVCAEEAWPFDLGTAERMTVPAGARLDGGTWPSAEHA
jgi:hypothetical protein